MAHKRKPVSVILGLVRSMLNGLRAAAYLGAIHLAHPARTNRVQDLVGPKRTPQDSGISPQFYTERSWLPPSGTRGIRSATR